VTVDWVVLTAGVVGMAMAFMPPIRDAIVNMAIYIGQTIDAYPSSWKKMKADLTFRITRLHTGARPSA
jgi:hypothetical protein